ncbi:MAG TPA: methyl-accepting chemotaxis protein [Longimicrobiaceae bacterium]|nr:methyl-accepting chemotaxis protein [Longimicrobiaceae bacterium]
MSGFFRTAARVLAAFALLSLIVFSLDGLLTAAEGGEREAAFAFAAIAYGFWVVGVSAYRRAANVPAGPAFLIHASSWTLYLPVLQMTRGTPAPDAAYVVFALGVALNGVSLLHFAAALAFPRRVAGWLRGFAAAYGVALVLWAAQVGAVFTGAPGVTAGLSQLFKAVDALAFFGSLALLAAGMMATGSARGRRQLGWAVAAIVIGLGPAWLQRAPGVGALVGAEVLPRLVVAELFWVLMPVGFFWATVRYNLFDEGRLRTRAQALAVELLLSSNVDELSRRALGALADDFELRATALWALDDAGIPAQIGGTAGVGEAPMLDAALRSGRAEALGDGTRAVLVYPVRYGDTVEAALWLERAASDPFEAGHQDYLGLVESPLGIALHLRRVDDRVRVTAEELTALAREVDTVAGELRVTGESVSTAVQEVSEGSASQTEDFRRIAQAVTGLRAASVEIARRLASADEFGGETLSRSRGAGEDVELLVARVKEGAARLGSVEREVQTLRERSGEIGAISTTIHEVAEQTNLLALNAAIEAARAGDHGRGFAVVADEVRKLAEGSAQSALRIGGIVEQVRAEIALVADAIGGARSDMAEGADGADRAAAALRESITQVARLRDEIAQVASLTSQAHTQNEMIADAVTRATDVSEQNAAAAEETAAATEQQLASLESVAASVKELSGLGGKMFQLLQSDRAAPGPYEPGAPIGTAAAPQAAGT